MLMYSFKPDKLHSRKKKFFNFFDGKTLYTPNSIKNIFIFKCANPKTCQVSG